MEYTICIDGNCLQGGPEMSPRVTLSLDEHGDVIVDEGASHSSERDSCPADVWEGRRYELSVSLPEGSCGIADPDKVADWVEQARPLLERMHQGHTVEWDGSSYRGRLTADGLDAAYDLEALTAEADIWKETLGEETVHFIV
jgi:hypothetical protein